MTFSFRSTWLRTRAILAGRRVRLTTLWVTALLALYALLGFFALPWLAKPKIEQAMGDALQRPVAIESLYTNPFSFSARIRGLRVLAPDGQATVLSLDEAYANVAFTSLFRRAPVLDRLRVVHPDIRLVRNEDGRYNIQDILDRYIWAEPPKDQPPARYSLNNIEVIGGHIEFDDRLEKQKHEVRDLRIGIPFLSSLPYETDVYVHPELSAVLNGAPLSLRGETKPFGERRESTLHLTFDKLDLRPYFGYVPVPLRFELASGALDAQLTLHMVSEQGTLNTLSLTGTAGLRDLLLRQRDGEPLLGAASLDISLHALDLVHRQVSLSSLRLSAPQLHVTRFRGGNLNLALLLPVDTGKPPTPSAKTAPQQPFRFSVDTLTVEGGRVVITDYAAADTFKTTLTDVALQGKGIGNQPDQRGTLEAALRIEGKDSIKAQAQAVLDAGIIDGRFELADVRIDRFQPYLGDERRLAGGSLGGSGQFHIAPSANGPGIRVANLNATLRNSRIDTPVGKNRWRADLLSVNGANIDLSKRDIVINRISGQEVGTTILREADGAWRLTGLLRIAAEETQNATKAAPEPAAKAWTYRIKSLDVERSTLAYEDRTTSQPVAVQASDIRAKLSDISNAADAKPQLSIEAAIGKDGRLSLSGPFALAPFNAKWEIAAKALPLAPWQPYWTDALDVAVSRGAVSLQGALDIATSATTPADIRYRGDVTVADFASADGNSKRDLLRWKQLRLQKTALRITPLELRIGSATLSDFYSRLIVRPDGRLNVQQLLAHKQSAETAHTPQSAAPASAPAPKPRIEIGDVTLRNGQLNFSDFFIKPNYSARITSLGGTVSALTPERPGRLDLHGEINEAAPVTIQGEINPLAPTLFLDINAKARDVNLPPLSPYSVHYVGYPIERGKLSMDVHYHVEGGELSAENRLTLNQLVFGEQPAGTPTSNLPVHLAVSLLKDRNGVIDLNVPISGSLNDPQFSIGGVIVKAFVNLLWKAVTAPFAALGAIFGGGGETLSYVEFAPGSAQLDEAAVQKLGDLAQALRERTNLNLDIAGRVDPATDEEGIKARTLLRRMKAQKRSDLGEDSAARPLDEIEIAPAEYDKYLERVYDNEKFDKPRNFIGFAKSVPAAEMKQRLLEHFAVNENALRRLADERATAALDWLKSTGNVPPERLYIVAPRLNAEGIDDKGAPNRVDFALH
jgi:uncharacterized protein involved in outer membrane biogenesis